MAKLTKDFFNDREILFVGYSSRNNVFSKMVYQALLKKGIRVYPMNTKANAEYDIKVYKSLDELPSIPQTAYVLLKTENAKTAVPQLAAKGVKKMLFQGGKVASPEILSMCKELGVEAVTGCPMMVVGSGMHRIHGFFAGVR